MQALRRSLLVRSKELVHSKGWDLCLQSAAEELNLSPAIVYQLFPQAPYEVINSLLHDWNEQLLVDFSISPELSNTALYLITRRRLEYTLPYATQWSEAIKIGARPQNFENTSKIMLSTFDTIWKLAGEKEFNMFYPARRGALAGLYYYTLAQMILKPESAESYLMELEWKVKRSFDGGVFVENMVEVGRFIACANYRFIQSMWPEPTEHKNPIKN